MRGPRYSILAATALVCGILASGCSTGSATKEETSTPILEMTIRVASLDVSRLNRRMTRTDVSDLWAIMKKEKVEILMVQNLTRYPGLATRVDLLNEYASLSGWRTKFGELVDNSGRLNGNAVLSAYPIRSSGTISFHTVKGAVFEGALQAVIDGGLREIITVSATYPEKGGENVKNDCRTLIAKARGNPSAPMILSGSNPSPRDGWQEVFAAGDQVGLQYDGVGAMQVLDSQTLSAKLGKISVATFGLYRTPKGSAL